MRRFVVALSRLQHTTHSIHSVRLETMHAMLTVASVYLCVHVCAWVAHRVCNAAAVAVVGKYFFARLCTLLYAYFFGFFFLFTSSPLVLVSFYLRKISLSLSNISVYECVIEFFLVFFFHSFLFFFNFFGSPRSPWNDTEGANEIER